MVMGAGLVFVRMGGSSYIIIIIIKLPVTLSSDYLLDTILHETVSNRAVLFFMSLMPGRAPGTQ